jgi:hypothetical protein
MDYVCVCISYVHVHVQAYILKGMCTYVKSNFKNPQRNEAKIKVQHLLYVPSTLTLKVLILYSVRTEILLKRTTEMQC